MGVDEIISNSVKEFEKIIAHLKDEFARLQVGRANSALVETVPVEMYGVRQPLKALASISIPDPRTIQIQPWDKSALAAVEKALVGVGTGLNPVNDGICIRVNIPPLTEERRAELVKHLKELAENSRIAVRNVRKDAHNLFRELKDSSDITEDDFYSSTDDLQKKVDDYIKKIDDLAQSKENDVMTV